MYRNKHLVVAAIVIGFLLVASAPSEAVSEAAAPCLAINPSVRAAGMGRVGTAVFWGGDPNYWANPALLGYHHGLRYDWGRTQLIPSLADDVYLKTSRFTVGAFGATLHLAGRPLDIGKTRLEYGIWQAMGESGEPGDFFSSWEEAKSWGIGVSVGELVDSMLRLLGADGPHISRFGDLSLGYASHKVHVVLAKPTAWTCEGAKAVGDAKDWGFLARVTPYNSIDFDGLLPPLDGFLDPLGGLRLDAGYGQGRKGYNDAEIAFIDVEQTAPLPNEKLEGWALRGAIGFPPGIRAVLDDMGLGWAARFFSPLVSYGRTWDWKESQLSDESTVKTTGWEVTLANVITLRRGIYRDPDGDICGTTSGWGLGMSYGRVAGFRYDRASVPNARGLDGNEREGFNLFVDPVALLRVLQE
ncbi:MAG: hypothetical protein KAW17_07625 [Candidatus Eisenbacteria sp.]|nr:hypothetical protein [Candidatus Eisenbacteria bacterium]